MLRGKGQSVKTAGPRKTGKNRMKTLEQLKREYDQAEVLTRSTLDILTAEGSVALFGGRDGWMKMRDAHDAAVAERCARLDAYLGRIDQSLAEIRWKL